MDIEHRSAAPGMVLVVDFPAVFDIEMSHLFYLPLRTIYCGAVSVIPTSGLK